MDRVGEVYGKIAQKHMIAQSEREKASIALTEAITSEDKLRIVSAEEILKQKLAVELDAEKERSKVDEEWVEQRHMFARFERHKAWLDLQDAVCSIQRPVPNCFGKGDVLGEEKSSWGDYRSTTNV